MLDLWKSGYIKLTPASKKLLTLLSDGKWHHKFHGIGTEVFEVMRKWGFLKIRFINKKKCGPVKAIITKKGLNFLNEGIDYHLVILKRPASG